jgi:hypothetical protein
MNMLLLNVLEEILDQVPTVLFYLQMANIYILVLRVWKVDFSDNLEEKFYKKRL